MESYLNTQLKENGWQIEISELSGHLFSTLHSNNVSLIHENGASVILPSISTKVKILSLIFGKVDIESLSVSNVTVNPYFESQKDSTSSNPIEFHPENIPLNIQNMYVDGNIYLPLNDSTRSFHFLIDGRINEGIEEMEIELREFELFCAVPKIDIVMKNINGSFSSQKIDIEVKKAIMNGFHIDGKFAFDRGEQAGVQAQFQLSEYEIPSHIFSKLPLQPKLSKISAIFNFESDFTHYVGDLFLRNELGLDMGGHFYLTKYSDYFRLESLELTGNDGILNIQGLFEDEGRFNGTIQLQSLDVSQWMLDQQTTNLSGYILTEGEINESQITAIDINAEINESLVFDRESTSFSGGISYKDYELTITNPLTMTIGPSIVTIEGDANFGSKKMNLNLALTNASTFLINNFWTDSLSSGTATGSMVLKGPFDTIGVNADLLISDFKYKNVSLSSFEFTGDLENINEFRDGNIKLKFGEGTWNDYGFENGSGEVKIFKDLFEISSFELKNGQDYLQFNGTIQNDSIVFLDRFQIAYEGHFLGNPKPLTITLLEDRIFFNPFEIHVDDGIIEGFVKTNPFEGRLKFSNVTAELFRIINSNNETQVLGNIFGEISIGQELNPDDFSMDITIKNGELAGQSFNEFYISSLFRDGILHLEELTLTEGDKTGFQIIGTFPIFADTTQPIPVDLQSNFKNIDMAILTQFAPKWENRILGHFTGKFNVGGTTEKTRFDLDGKIENTFFERIPLGTVRGHGQYANKKLEFSQFSSTWNENQISGSAILPIDYDMASPNVNNWHPEGELNVKTQGLLHSAVFLSEYLAETDSIIGDIKINLDINGPPEKLNRNGHINIENGEIYTVLMDEPVRQISTNAILVDNQLSIQSFSGTVYDTHTKVDSTKNLKISGGLDFTKFFEPRFDLHAIGNDVFYRSLNGDIEGYGDLDVSILGKDTLEINGIVAAKRGAVYMEFSGDDAVESAKAKGRTTTNYNIRFPIEDSFSIRNSQIDAKISGEIAMSKQFDGDWDYSGEIEFIEGEIYYYVGDVFENLQGVMTLDGKGFNPFLDLSASTKIGDAEIILGVFGPFDNPEWRFDSDKGYTESDILQLLTFNTRVAEEGFTTEGLGTQAQTILGAYLERQLERNFIQATGLKSAGLVEGVEISGDLLNPSASEEFAISARINKSFSFSYKRSFSLEGAYKKKVGVEYKLNPNFSVIGNVDETGNIHMKFRVRRIY